MSQTPYHDRIPVRVATPQRPGQDMHTVNDQAKQFPGIGMTLRNYKYDPSDRYKRSAQTVVLKGRWARFKRKVTRKRAAIACAVVILLIGAFVGGKFLYNLHKLFGGNIFGIFSTTRLRGENTGHVNILLAGNSADDPGHNGANLTDSIMLISIDTRHNTAFMLSIPRDLWVQVGDTGYEKINAAYVTGQADSFSQSGYPKGGMGQLEQVVSQDFGVPIDYYSLIDYKALKDAVNAVGGINININTDDPRGLYDPDIDYATNGPLVDLTNGSHHLNGEQALDLARARGDAYGSYGFNDADFDRTEHQRQMLVALKEKAVSLGTLSNPDKLTKLFDAVGNNIQTDFKPPEVHRLYDLTKNIKGSNIRSLSLNNVNGMDLLSSYAAPGGQSALIPAAGIDNFYDIQSYVSRQMSSNPIIREGADVVVLNGTATDGIATKAKKKITAKNIIVSQVGDAPGQHPTSMIIDASDGDAPATLGALKHMFGSHVTKSNPYAGIYDADFIVIVGNDQIAPLTHPTTNSN